MLRGALAHVECKSGTGIIELQAPFRSRRSPSVRGNHVRTPRLEHLPAANRPPARADTRRCGSAVRPYDTIRSSTARERRPIVDRATCMQVMRPNERQWSPPRADGRHSDGDNGRRRVAMPTLWRESWCAHRVANVARRDARANRFGVIRAIPIGIRSSTARFNEVIQKNFSASNLAESNATQTSSHAFARDDARIATACARARRA